jgi:hypothetical protein
MRHSRASRPVKILAGLSLAFALPPAAPASVQPATTQIIGDSLACPRAAAGEVQVCARRMTIADIINLHLYASCLVRHHRLAAQDAVHAYVAEHSREGLRALVVSDKWCKPDGATRVSAVLLAGALAERLPGWQQRLRKGFDADQPGNDLAHCLIAADRRSTLAMLRASPLSPKEGEATARLAVTMPSCIPAGVRFETHRPALRSVLALALFDPASFDSGQPAGLGSATPIAASMPGIEAQPVAATLAPLANISRVREQVRFIPRITAHHVSPDLPPQLLEEDMMAAAAAWPIDEDTGEAPAVEQQSTPFGQSIAPPNPEG